MQKVVLSNSLGLMFHRWAPNQCIFQFFQNCFVNFVTKIFEGTMIGLKHYRGFVIRQLSFRFCINSHQFQIGPHFLQKAVIIPFVMSRYWNTVRNFTHNIQFFNGNLKETFFSVTLLWCFTYSLNVGFNKISTVQDQEGNWYEICLSKDLWLQMDGIDLNGPGLL